MLLYQVAMTAWIMFPEQGTLWEKPFHPAVDSAQSIAVAFQNPSYRDPVHLDQPSLKRRILNLL